MATESGGIVCPGAPAPNKLGNSSSSVVVVFVLPLAISSNIWADALCIGASPLPALPVPGASPLPGGIGESVPVVPLLLMAPCGFSLYSSVISLAWMAFCVSIISFKDSLEYVAANSYISYFLHPAKNDSRILSAL